MTVTIKLHVFNIDGEQLNGIFCRLGKYSEEIGWADPTIDCYSENGTCIWQIDPYPMYRLEIFDPNGVYTTHVETVNCNQSQVFIKYLYRVEHEEEERRRGPSSQLQNNLVNFLLSPQMQAAYTLAGLTGLIKILRDPKAQARMEQFVVKMKPLIDRLPDLLPMLVAAYGGYRAFKYLNQPPLVGAMTGILGLKLASSMNLAAGAAGVGLLASIGLCDLLPYMPFESWGEFIDAWRPYSSTVEPKSDKTCPWGYFRLCRGGSSVKDADEIVCAKYEAVKGMIAQGGYYYC